MFSQLRYYRFNIFIFLFVILSLNISFAQQKSVLQIIKNDIGDSFQDGIKTYSAPLHFNAKDWITTGAVLITTSALFLKDESFRAYSKKNHSDINDKIMDVGSAYGNLITPVAIGGSVYLYGLAATDDYVRVTGRMVFESVLYSGIVTTVLKSVTGRYRPYTNAGSNFFLPMQIDEGRLSFPSGHSTVAFAISSVLSNRIHNVYASVGLYTLAGVTSLSRVYRDDHWVSDAFFGSAIGYFIGDYISSNSVSSSKNKLSYKLYPGLSNINLVVSF